MSFNTITGSKVIDLVLEIVAILEDVPDGCSDQFPFDVIDELKAEYLED